MARQLNAAKIAEHWAQRMSQSGQRIKDGVSQVTVSPTVAAAAKIQKYQASILEAINSGRLYDRLMATPLNAWKDQMLKVGVDRVATGAIAAQSKFSNFMNKLIPNIESARAAISNMPNDTIQQRLARANAFAMAMHETKGEY